MALEGVRAGIRNEAGIAAVLGILKQSFGERFQTGQAIREQHAHTTTYLPAQLPDGVVFVEKCRGCPGRCAGLRGAQGAACSLRHGIFAGGAGECGGGRYFHRFQPHEIAFLK